MSAPYRDQSGYNSISERTPESTIPGMEKTVSKVLIIDDDPNICTQLKRFLEEMNHSVLVSHGETEALEKIKDMKPDIIILDLIMGGIGGMEVLKQVRQFDKRVSIITMSALTNESICTESLDTGADMYITKPVDYYHLTTNILPHLINIKQSN